MASGTNFYLTLIVYCGTGTSLVEANIKGINAIGTDLNPLAKLVAKAKTTIIKPQNLEHPFMDFNDYLFQFRYGLKKKDSLRFIFS
jgi:hypothetical protein